MPVIVFAKVMSPERPQLMRRLPEASTKTPLDPIAEAEPRMRRPLETVVSPETEPAEVRVRSPEPALVRAPAKETPEANETSLAPVSRVAPEAPPERRAERSWVLPEDQRSVPPLTETAPADPSEPLAKASVPAETVVPPV